MNEETKVTTEPINEEDQKIWQDGYDKGVADTTEKALKESIANSKQAFDKQQKQITALTRKNVDLERRMSKIKNLTMKDSNLGKNKERRERNVKAKFNPKDAYFET